MNPHINIQEIPKGQKIVIATRANGNTELRVRPDFANGQMAFSSGGGESFFAVALFVLALILYLLFNGRSARTVDGHPYPSSRVPTERVANS